MRYPDTVVLVFAKAPVAGKVNTRLIPAIGVDKATQLQSDLVQNRLSMLDSARFCDVVLYCMPDTVDSFFQECKKRYSILLKQQQGANLGARMAHAITEQSAVYKNIILIGTDAPSLDAVKIETAIQTLQQGCDIVLVPAEDGGYVLIGMNRCHETVFFSVPWGTDRVLIKTRANVVAAGLKMVEMEACWDIDRHEDYLRYLSEHRNE